MEIKNNCRFFRGDKPCKFKKTCENCPHFTEFGTRILIIKCGAMGDVLRTTTLLSGLKRKYPSSHVTWVVDPESEELLKNNKYIDRVIPYSIEELPRFLVEKYDVLISLDKETKSIALASEINAEKKFGFGMNEHGNLTIFNEASKYAFRLGVDDELKFYRNKKTYQEIIYEICEIKYERDDYVFTLKEENKQKAKNFFLNNKVPSKKCIGLNTGAGTKFETKRWPKENFLSLIELLKGNLDVNIFLLGGQREREINNWIIKNSSYEIYDTGTDNTLLEFAGFISLMDLVVTSDSLAMHLAIALKKKVIVLFGPTCPQEIELYSRGRKLFAGVECSPCYKKTCEDLKCMKEITPEEVFSEIKGLLKNG
ncbi:glycosyltransferase family 9 protein [Candidatus Aminicenantes bacterium AC-335-A11]|jgi:heptosyltransferase-2|nr:glycosyltransferase family 9 protein [SCandidatus Aminicenantes bacterium Aminicenantia_JdfR_composite]MCP2597348.1 glycosyltransferase family 9 protein [Candidatus Aminicenantes bacterium AC-335-G13]MCP2598112.1 glycosyltransferase family 9 protein [Candidatus Aminicenantes bacterium AC-335-L06]MCP2618037.1 glycosyltransferase family 9 protein [Candidatus Aminicenantes bacterium AC-335-A11]